MVQELASARGTVSGDMEGGALSGTLPWQCSSLAVWLLQLHSPGRGGDGADYRTRTEAAVIELRQLCYLVLAAESGSFSRAAKRLGIKQSTLSRQLLALEKRLGIEMFERVSRGAVLTSAGQSYLKTAERIVREFGELNSWLQDTRKGRSGRLAVGFYTSFSAGNLRATLEEIGTDLPRQAGHQGSGTTSDGGLAPCRSATGAVGLAGSQIDGAGRGRPVVVPRHTKRNRAGLYGGGDLIGDARIDVGSGLGHGKVSATDRQRASPSAILNPSRRSPHVSHSNLLVLMDARATSEIT